VRLAGGEVTNGVDRNRQVTDRIASAQVRLRGKLTHLDMESSGISEYNQRCLGDRIRDAKSVLQRYGRLLHLSLSQSHVRLEELVLVDYGGGSGLLSFLAKEMGIGTVIYNDIYDVSCADVRRLSSVFGLALTHIVCGDVEDLISYLRKNSLSVDAIVSYDVLEHIHDVERHFEALASLSNHPFRVVYASGANIRNPRYVRSVTRQQMEAEYKNREKTWGHKERDSLRAYCAVRKDMISAYAPNLSPEEVEALARLTRGLVQREIETCIDEYRRKGSIAYRPDHPTNTCDPYTGSWCEHLLEFGRLEQVLTNSGFSAEIWPGYYGVSGSFFKGGLKLLLNAVIRLWGKPAMFLAPYYVVCADSPTQRRAPRSGPCGPAASQD
jgi:2-polyprenyl-3-methyl-5-hydroxy-6-metoxy-1,4-benzoquinol methylase